MSEDIFIFKNLLNCSVIPPGCFVQIGSKYVVGDQKGLSQMFSLKKGSSGSGGASKKADLIFSHNAPKEESIKSLSVTKDRIYTAVGTQVRVLSRKGREVQSFENNLALHGVAVRSGHLLFFNDYFLYRLRDEEEEPEMFLSNEKILSIFVFEDFVYFCCNNQTLNRIHLQNEDFDSIDHTFHIPHNITSYCFHPKNGFLYFGTQKGLVGRLNISSKVNREPETLLEMEKHMTIQSLTFFHFTDADPQDLKNWHLALGFTNGELLIFSSDFKTEYLSKKIQGTSITNLLPTPNNKSLLLSTYSGDVAILEERKSDVPPSPNTSSSSPLSKQGKQDHVERRKLSESIAYRERILKDLKRRYARISREHVGTKLTYTPKCRFFLVDDYYLLSVRCDVNIESVILYSQSVRVNILGKPDGFDVDKSYHRENASCYFVLTCIGDAESKGLEVRCRTLEGNYGDLEVFVVPKRTPKISTKVTLPIKPLSLHERVSDSENENVGKVKVIRKKKGQEGNENKKQEKNVSKLTVSGEFSIETVHHWIWGCCNDVPARIVGEKSEMKYFFRNSYQGTFLRVWYRENEMEFESDNISTISILEEFISKQATLKNTKVKIRFKMNFKSIGDMIKTHLFPRLQEEFMYQEKMHILESIKEMSEHGGGEGCLMKQNQNILEREEEIRERLGKKKVNLQFLYDILVRLCRDQAKFKRANPQPNLNALREVLRSQFKDFTVQKLLRVFSKKE